MINYDLTRLRALIFDVDGVLSRPVMNLSPEGDPVRTVNVKDGYAMQLAVKTGLNLCIITGARVESVRWRYEGLGIKDVYIASSVKMNDFNHFVRKYDISQNLAIICHKIIWCNRQNISINTRNRMTVRCTIKHHQT